MASGINYRKLYPKTRIKGFEEVINNIQKEIDKIEGLTEVGLIKAMEMVHKEAVGITPMDTGNLRASWFIVTNSGVQSGGDAHFTYRKYRKNKSKTASGKSNAQKMASEHSQVLSEMASEANKNTKQIQVLAGYSASYALYVHEMETKKPSQGDVMDDDDEGGKKINWTTAGTKGKWLEKTFKSNEQKFIQILKENVRI